MLCGRQLSTVQQVEAHQLTIPNNKYSIDTFGVLLCKMLSSSQPDKTGHPPVNGIWRSGTDFVRFEDALSLLDYTVESYPLSCCSRLALTFPLNTFFTRYITLRLDFILNVNI